MSTLPNAHPLSRELTKLDSRAALAQRLNEALADVPREEAISLLSDILWLWSQDRQNLIHRVASLLLQRGGNRSERATQDQLVLFDKVLKVLAEVDTPEAEAKAPAPSNKALLDIITDTNADIERVKEQLAQERAAARRLEQEKRRENGGEPTLWPENLTVRTTTLEPSDDLRCCDDCGCPRQVLRYEESWRLERETRTYVGLTRIPILGCPSHHGSPVQPPVPTKPVDGGRLGFSLAAYILYLRIVQNLPTRRIVEMLASEGAPVSESMVGTLIATTAERAQPLYLALRHAVQQASRVNLDDTPVAVHIGHSPRQTTTGRVWLALGDEKMCFFFATTTWKTKEAVAKLGKITGVLQGDGYKGFRGYAASQDVDLAGCMDHLRRKLLKALKAGDARAELPLALANGLYRIEELARLRRATPDELLALRQERAVPLFNGLLAWLERERPGIVKGEPLGVAWTYLNNQQEPLATYLTNPVVSIHNASAERGLRRITIGRKLWLFHRGHDSLQAVATLLSVTSTARLHGVDELAYLRWVLERLADREWSQESATALLPAAFAEKQRAEQPD